MRHARIRSTASWSWRSPRARCSTSRKRTASSKRATTAPTSSCSSSGSTQPAQAGHRLSAGARSCSRFNDAGAAARRSGDPVAQRPGLGLRVFRSAQAHGLAHRARRVHARARSPYALPAAAERATCSSRPTQATCAGRWTRGFPAARVYPESAQAAAAHPDEVRIAFDGDAVLFSDEAERVYQATGSTPSSAHEASTRRSRCRRARSSRCSKRCTGCSTARRPTCRCASAPRWSRRAARRRTSARSAR